jgi:hypothetical protein
MPTEHSKFSIDCWRVYGVAHHSTQWLYTCGDGDARAIRASHDKSVRDASRPSWPSWTHIQSLPHQHWCVFGNRDRGFRRQHNSDVKEEFYEPVREGMR